MPGHLLALRRRHVDLRLHARSTSSEPRAVLNPLRSEQEAFRFLIYVAVVVARSWSGSSSLLRALCERRPGAGRARGARGRRGAARATSARPPRGVEHEVHRHRPGLGRRPRGRAGDPRAARGRAARRRPAGRGGLAQRGRQRPALGRRPARRHHQLPLRLPGLGGERGARGRRRRGRWAWCTTRPRRDLPRRARRGRRARRRAARACASAATARPGARGHRLLLRARAARRPGRGARARCCPRVRDIRRAGAAALDLAWLAAGRVDALLRARPEAAGTGRPGACWWRRPAARVARARPATRRAWSAASTLGAARPRWPERRGPTL